MASIALSNITPKITKEKYPIASPSFLKPGTRDWEPLQAASCCNSEDDKEQMEKAQETLKNFLLQSLQMQHLVVLAGSGCSIYAGAPSMSNLWDAVIGEPPSESAKEIAGKIDYNLQEKNIELFLSKAEALLSVIKNETIIMNFLNEAKQKIHEKCSDFLVQATISPHKTFLHRLSRRRTRDQRLCVFTTNYDLCFERAAIEVGNVAIDGFSFMAPRHYDPRYYDYDIVRRSRSGDDGQNYLEGVFLLYKLHGSVNWEKTDKGIFEKEKPDPQNACFIYPASGKYQQSYNQPFIESISRYLAAIREPNTCLLVIGFGFNDDHLSEPLLSAVHSNPHLRLIVVAPDAEKNANTPDNMNRYHRELFELSERGEDVWFVNDTFQNFANRIPDLKSLTLAERLFRDIKGAMQSQ